MPENKNKHLTISDRTEIEKGLTVRESFARRMGVSTSTVSREVKQNRTVTAIDRRSFSLCARKGECSLSKVCGSCPDRATRRRECRKARCFSVCGVFEKRRYDLLEKAPFVYGECTRRMSCHFRHAEYRAVEAQLRYEYRLTESREGRSLDAGELVHPVGIVRSHLQKGWSFEAT